jgi:branched-chain amino acid transport system substrate-binding protein
MRGSAVLGVAAAVVLAFAAGCGGSEKAPYRIAVLADCSGVFSSLHDSVLASAELPLLERGGRLRGKTPSDGVAGARAAGRPVELLSGCVHSNTEVLNEARRLVEEDGAALVVGTADPQNGFVLRQYARRRPETTFVVQPSDGPELTLWHPLPNVFRFVPDAAQWTAGLGSYAYNDLGWRTAVTIGDNVPYGWGAVSGFVAEFCALGGRIVQRHWVPVGADPASLVPRLPASADGVFLGTAIAPPSGFVKAYAARGSNLPRRLVVGPAVPFEVALPLVEGVVIGGSPALEPTAAEGRYVAEFTREFPALGAHALDPLVFSYRDAVEAALQALERADGRDGPALREALAHVQLHSPVGLIRLDRNRQAVVSNYLSRAVAGPDGKPVFKTVKVVRNVEQTFGGYFTPQSPPRTRTTPACRKATPPPWAR